MSSSMGIRPSSRCPIRFRLQGEIADKIIYTGLVAGAGPRHRLPKSFDIVVSAGGGAVGSGSCPLGSGDGQTHLPFADRGA